MREIKYKIWSEIDKKFLENPHYINSNWIIFFSPCKWPVINYENQEKYKILQYTWLTDKNWKEIFEGDLVKTQINNLWLTKELSEVYFDMWQFLLKRKDSKMPFTVYQESELEIIWNIYENPNLLENGKV